MSGDWDRTVRQGSVEVYRLEPVMRFTIYLYVASGQRSGSWRQLCVPSSPESDVRIFEELPALLDELTVR
jgi:hypothetical protein